jgi:hypothetical protein
MAAAPGGFTWSGWNPFDWGGPPQAKAPPLAPGVIRNPDGTYSGPGTSDPYYFHAGQGKIPPPSQGGPGYPPLPPGATMPPNATGPTDPYGTDILGAFGTETGKLVFGVMLYLLLLMGLFALVWPGEGSKIIKLAVKGGEAAG